MKYPPNEQIKRELKEWYGASEEDLNRAEQQKALHRLYAIMKKAKAYSGIS